VCRRHPPCPLPLSLPDALPILGVASAGAALAPGFETLVAMRVAQGAGGALAAPAALALLRALFPAPAGFARAMAVWGGVSVLGRSEEHTSELQSRENLVCRLLL